VVARSHPIRFAVERAEKNATTLSQEYFSASPYTYASSWNSSISLTHPTHTVADLLDVFPAAGLWIEQVLEPQLNEEDRPLPSQASLARPLPRDSELQAQATSSGPPVTCVW
jgi:hypothetical protein